MRLILCVSDRERETLFPRVPRPHNEYERDQFELIIKLTTARVAIPGRSIIVAVHVAVVRFAHAVHSKKFHNFNFITIHHRRTFNSEFPYPTIHPLNLFCGFATKLFFLSTGGGGAGGQRTRPWCTLVARFLCCFLHPF